MTRFLSITTALLLMLSLGLGVLLTQANKENGKLNQKLEIATLQVKFSGEQCKKNADLATSNYDSLADSCRESIRAAVSAFRIQVIEVPKYVEDGSPNPMCPTVSLRDIQDAGSTPVDVPSSSNSKGSD